MFRKFYTHHYTTRTFSASLSQSFTLLLLLKATATHQTLENLSSHHRSTITEAQSHIETINLISSQFFSIYLLVKLLNSFMTRTSQFVRSCRGSFSGAFHLCQSVNGDLIGTVGLFNISCLQVPYLTVIDNLCLSCLCTFSKKSSIRNVWNIIYIVYIFCVKKLTFK